MATVTAYWRPTSMSHALALLDRPGATVLGGGTRRNRGPSDGPIEVVDLQALGLDGTTAADCWLRIGAMTTLQAVADDDRVPPVVREIARRELPSTLRTQATVGGCVASGEPDSELLAALLAHQAIVHVTGPDGAEDVDLETVLAGLPLRAGRIIVAVTIRTTGTTALARTARTRADRAIVAAVARTDGDRRWMALAGVAPTPILVGDVADAGGLDPPGDFRGSTEYRRVLAATLLARAVEELA